MSDAHRRARFTVYFHEKMADDRGAFLRKTGYTKGRLNQFLDPNEPLGEKAARELERRLGLAAGYLDLYDKPEALSVRETPAPYLTPEQLELLALWEPLFSDQRADLLGAIRIAHARALRTLDEVQKRGLLSRAPEDVLPPEFTRPAQRDLAIEPPGRGKKGK